MTPSCPLLSTIIKFYWRFGDYEKKWFAALLSLIIPGIGQFYTRQYLLGFSLIGLLVIFEVLSNITFDYFIFTNVIIWGYSIIKAYKEAGKINNEVQNA